MDEWEVFVGSLDDLAGDRELILSVRTLAPGRRKYTYRRVRARVSADPGRYPHRLRVRFGRGQPHGQPFSIEILEELPLASNRAAGWAM
jgi:phenylphosphate carboxylase gamma subunit